MVFLIEATLPALVVLSSIGSVVILVYLASTKRQAPRFQDSLTAIPEVPAKKPFLSIIIAARNEEDEIGKCIASLLEQTYGDFELIVVDDSSSDRTPEIAAEYRKKDPRVLLITTGNRPEGWAGKSWPCWTGYQRSRGENLLFVDADSHFRSDAIELAVKYFEARRYDMFSISPKVKLKGIWSHSTVPFLSGAINLLYPMKNVNEPKSKRAYVFGTFVLARRAVYEAIGGHEKVKDRLVEDAAIAFEAKSKGYRLRVEADGELFETDWESGFSEIFHGLERIFSDSVKSYGLLSSLNSILVFFLALFPLLVLIYGLAYFFLFRSASLLLLLFIAAGAVGVASVLLAVAGELRSAAGKAGFYPFLFPLGASLFIAGIITSTSKIARGRAFEWKGGKYVQRAGSQDKKD